MAEPWKGKHYDATKLLLLGESAYSWSEDDMVHHPRDDHAKISVRAAIDNFPYVSRFMVMLSRALANEYEPAKPKLDFVWNQVAFINYIEATVGEGARKRPTTAMFEAAKLQFRPLLEELRPRRLIILGLGMWFHMPETDIYISDPVQGYRLTDGSVAMCHALPHPAGGLSWRALAEIIHFTYHSELSRESND